MQNILVTSSPFHDHHFNKKACYKKIYTLRRKKFLHLNCCSHSKGRCFTLSRPPDYPAHLFKCTAPKNKGIKAGPSSPLSAMAAFSPGCQQSPPSIRGIKGETGSDMTNNKSTSSSLLSRQSLGSSCLSPSCTLMSRGNGLALCLRGSSGER